MFNRYVTNVISHLALDLNVGDAGRRVRRRAKTNVMGEDAVSM